MEITEVFPVREFRKLRLDDFFIIPTTYQKSRTLTCTEMPLDFYSDNEIYQKIETEKGIYAKSVSSGEITKISNNELIIRVEIEDTKININSTCMDFSDALRAVKSGQKITRTSWANNCKIVVYQKGYPDGINCNKQTAIAWGINEGDLFKCNPYLQIQNEDSSHSMWVPSIDDILADDWVLVSISTYIDIHA